MKNYLAFVAIPSILNAFSTAVSSASTFKAVSEVPRSHPHWGIGGGTPIYTGRPRSDVQTLTLLYTIFDRKGTPLIYRP